MSATKTLSSLGHIPGAKWTFDEDVTYRFDDMLRRSVPLYDVMRETCFRLACRYRQPKTDIVDLGASRGEAVAPLVDTFGATNHFVLVEIAEPMLEVLRQRFRGMINCGVVQVRADDLRHSFPPVRASVILSVLTVQFTPIEHRHRIVRQAFEALVPGGALILVEKVLGGTMETDQALVSEYLAMKADNGYTQEEIERKRLALEGVLVPLTAEWNEHLLRRSGFEHVECFWRWMNFAGWVAVK